MIDPPEMYPGPFSALRAVRGAGVRGLCLQTNQEARDREDASYGRGMQTLPVSDMAIGRL